MAFRSPTPLAAVSGTLRGSSCLVAASDASGIARVGFSIDGRRTNVDWTAPWSCLWNTSRVPNGRHRLAATATDRAGNRRTVAITVVTVARLATVERGTLNEFSSINAGNVGKLSVDSSRAYTGSRSGHASTPSGQFNKYARGIWNVSWRGGTNVWYGGAIYLPPGFYSRQQGDVDVIRWDNWALLNRSQDQSGVTIRWDGKLALLFKNLDTGEYANLIPPVAPLSAGRWHWIDVRQKLGGDGAAINELWVDGRQVGTSSRHNWRGRRVTHHRIGLVSQDARRQTNPLELWFDRGYISTRRLGPAPS